MYERIRALRKDRDREQRDLAAYLQCTQTCGSRHGLGARGIPTQTLLILAEFYGVTTDYLLG